MQPFWLRPAGYNTFRLRVISWIKTTRTSARGRCKCCGPGVRSGNGLSRARRLARVDTIRARVGNPPRSAGALPSRPQEHWCSRRRAPSCTGCTLCVVALLAMRRRGRQVCAGSITPGRAPRRGGDWWPAGTTRLLTLRAWRNAQGCPRVVRESPVGYWKPLSPDPGGNVGGQPCQGACRAPAAREKDGQRRGRLAGGTLRPWPGRTARHPTPSGASVARSAPDTRRAGPDPTPRAQSPPQGGAGDQHHSGARDVGPLWHQWPASAHGVMCGRTRPAPTRSGSHGDLPPPGARSMPGIKRSTARDFSAEIGADRRRFGSATRVSSWAGAGATRRRRGGRKGALVFLSVTTCFRVSSRAGPQAGGVDRRRPRPDPQEGVGCGNIVYYSNDRSGAERTNCSW